MKMLVALVISAAAALAMPAASQSSGSERTIASINAQGWTFYGNNQTRERIKDESLPGKAAIRVTVPNAGGQASGASGQSRINAGIKQGQRVRVTIWLRGVSTVAGGPAKAIVKLKDAAPPYSNHAEQTFDLASNWKPYSIEYVALRDFPAGSLNMVVQLALGQQAVDVGPATTVIVQ